MGREAKTSMHGVSWRFFAMAIVLFSFALAVAVSSFMARWNIFCSDTLFQVSPALFLLMLLAPVVGCTVAAYLTRHHEHRAWGLLALGTAMMAVADASAVILGGTAGPALVDGVLWPSALWLASLVAYGVALLDFLDTPWTLRSARVRNTADISFAVLLSALASLAIAVFPAFGSSPGLPLKATLVNWATMACGVGVLLYIASCRPRVRAWHTLLLGALLFLITGSAFNFAALAAGHVDLLAPRMTYIPWTFAYTCIAVAAAVRVAVIHSTPRDYVVYSEHPTYVAGVLSTLALFAALPGFVYQIETWSGEHLGYTVYAITLTLACMTAVARSVLVVVENSGLRHRSTTDPLTGLSNHRHFHERLEEELIRSKREGIPLSLAIIDVDDFDRVNNIYGHRVGDLRLCAIGESVAASSRGFDIACRVGGDEYALIMPNADPLEAFRVCLRIQERVGHDDGVCPLPTSLSVGIASYPNHSLSREDLVQRADGALYWAKYHGRNQIVVYDPDLVRALDPASRISLLEEESYLDTVRMLAAAVDARDSYTQAHSRQVATLATCLATELGYEPVHCRLIETAALLHDIGKIGVTDEILRKPGALTDQEYAHVQEHPLLAVHMLASIAKKEILPWIAGHHEHWDGSGYPEGISGEQIPIEARILAVCDAYDAMTTDRPYRSAFTTERAQSEIAKCAGTQFDPVIATRFVEMLGKPEARLRIRRHAAPLHITDTDDATEAVSRG